MDKDHSQMAGQGAADQRVGQVIDGRYRIVATLGRGGMGIVYRAEHVAIQRPVALKLIHPELGSSPDFVKRFEREAVAMGRLDHTNCVSVSDFGKLDDGAVYLAMELLSGEPLSAALARERRFPIDRALRITRHVLRGLRHAHRADVVHRDLKPENVFLVAHDDDPHFAKILDFGIAKLVGPGEAEGADKLTQTGFAIGTPKYIAPELAFGDKVTPQADLYSMAVMAFEMITGTPPFVGEDPVAVLTMHAGKPVPPMSEMAPDLPVPPAVEALIQQGLAKRREERIASADEFLARIDEILAGLYEQPPAAGAPPARPSLPPRPDSLPPAPAETPLPGLGAAPTVGALPHARAPVPEQGPPPQHTEIVRSSPRDSWRLPAKILGGILAVAIVVGLAAQGCPAGGNGFRGYVEQLQNGKTCEERREAVRGLRALGDERAIEPLRRARHRMRGGVLGMGAKNTNACLKDEAETAIRQLRRR